MTGGGVEATVSTKKCTKCGRTKPLDEFHKRTKSRLGVGYWCKACCSDYDKLREQMYREKYGHTTAAENRRRHPNCYAGMCYRSLRNRCRHSLSYNGREYLARDEWDKWYEATKPEFLKLYRAWQESGFDRGLSPSVDRIDNSKGYTPDNMRWLTAHDNKCRPRGKYTKRKVKDGQ